MVSKNVLERGKELAQHGVRNLWFGSEMVYGLVEGSDDMVHTPNVWTDGYRLCGCQGYWYSDDDVCSHIVAIIESVPSETTRQSLYKELNDRTMQEIGRDFVQTSLEPFNEMMSYAGDPSNGGLPRKTGIGIAGRPEAGKTILSYQFAFDVLRALREQEEDFDDNVLILDTEGSGDTYKAWKGTFCNRFGFSEEEISLVPVAVDVYSSSDGIDVDLDYRRDTDATHQFFIMDVRELTDILALHGRPARIKTDKKKMQIVPNGDFVDVFNSGMGKFVKNNDIAYLAYDSVSNPLEVFTNRQPDRPTRSKATQWWLLQAQAMAQKMNLVMIIVAHLSKNPQKDFERPDIIGGKAVKHQTKFEIYLQEREDTTRSMRLFRHPSKEPWTDQWWFDLQTGKGFIERDPQED